MEGDGDTYEDDSREAQEPAAKRSRGATTHSTALVVASSAGSSAIIPAAAAANPFASASGRSSNLEAPIMHLTGHKSAVYAVRFDPTGQHIATAGKDRDILLWNVYGEADNYALLRGHKNAVLELAWASDGATVFSASADKTAAMWDAQAGVRLRSFTGAGRIVNSVAVAGGSGSEGSRQIATVSDDGAARLYDTRAKQPSATLSDKYPLLGVAFNSGGETLFTAGVEGVVHVWDVRKGSISMSLRGHSDVITGIAPSPDGSRLLSLAMDGTARIWDVRPFCPLPDRCTRVLTGAANSFEQAPLKPAWSGDGERVAAGSAADRMVYVWEAETGKLEYRLPGHSGEWPISPTPQRCLFYTIGQTSNNVLCY